MVKKNISAMEYAKHGLIHPDHAAQVIRYYKNTYHDWYGSPHKDEDGVVDPTAKHYVTSQLADDGNSIKFTHASGPNKGKSWKLKIGHLPVKEEFVAEKKTTSKLASLTVFSAQNTNVVTELPAEMSKKPCVVKVHGEEHILEKSKGDEYEYDYEGDMAMSQLKSIMTNAKCIHDMLEPNTNLPEWVQSKITLAKDYIETACDYLQTQMNEEFVTEAFKLPPEYIKRGYTAARRAHGGGMTKAAWESFDDETKSKIKRHAIAIAFSLHKKAKADARKNKKVKKKSIEEARSLTFQQRLARGRQMRRIEPKVYRGQLRYQDRVPSESRLKNRAERMARNVIKMKISHTPYDQMSIPEKIMVDKILERKQQAIKRLAQRLLPKVRKMSIQRISGPGTQPKMPMQRLTMGEETIPYLSESVETIYALASGEEIKAVKALKEKAEKAGVSFEEIVGVYSEAVQQYTPRKISSEQYAFNAVNSFVSNKINEDFKQMSINQMFSETMGIVQRLANMRKTNPPAPSTSNALDTAVTAVGELGTEQSAKSKLPRKKPAGTEPQP